MKTQQEYEKEIAELKAQLDELRAGAYLTMAGAKTHTPSGQSFTIDGLDELILLVDPKNVIGFVNAGMARLLGSEHKKNLMGAPVANWDSGPLGDGFISTLVESARRSGQAYVMERPFTEFPKERLDKASHAMHNRGVLLRFVATPVKERVQIVVQDVSHMRWLENTFSRYVSPRVIELLQGVPDSELMRVERRSVTLLFADLRGFTSACQEMEAEEVCEMLNEYLTNMVECIERYDGTVDKFVGDEVMAIFGAPLYVEDHALRAMMAAARMMKRHREWMKGRNNQGKIAPDLGLGIATGEVVIGNIGTPRRMDYTALGHTVNLAARLCGKAAGGEILTVRSTHEAAAESAETWKGEDVVPRFKFEHRGKIELKNVKAPVDLYAVML